MIDIVAKIHDKYSIEFKVGFVTRRKTKVSDFAVNTWMFIPNSLDINPLTYGKSQFYRDVKSNIRLITPIFLLREIVSGNAIPLHNLSKAFEALSSSPLRSAIREYEYQIKMFSAIFKSAMRNEVLHIVNNPIEEDIEFLVSSYLNNLEEICIRYRELRRIINVPTISPEVLDYYFFGDEFISNTIEHNTSRIIRFLQYKDKEKYRKSIANLADQWHKEKNYRKEKGYIFIENESPTRNRAFVFRKGVLKKYVESDLFLQARKKKDGVFVEQIYYSIAAGLSMIFATAVAFSVQMKYGNFTMPLFVALVVSYMLKDRIKDLMRYYFAHQLGSRYFDNKTKICIKEVPIGWSKEGMDFITDDKVPREVMDIRSRSSLVEAENRTMDEKILLYRKLVRINREEIKKNSDYSIAGINDIMRLHLTRFMQKMDNPDEALYLLNEDNSVSVIQGEKVYYLNIVMQLQVEDQISYKRFRVVFTQSGITELEELK